MGQECHVDEIVKTMKSHSQLNEDYKKLHAENNPRITKLGGAKIEDNYLHNFIDRMGADYRAGLT